MNYAETIAQIIDWLRSSTPAGKKLLIPVSGGSDSAFCYWLCTQVFGDRVEVVYIGTDLREKEWFEKQGRVHYGVIEEASNNPEVARWAYFLARALQTDSILVGSRNRTEDTLGTYSTASKVSSFLPLANLWKHEVMGLCEFAGVPDTILTSSSRADPACGRPEEMAAIEFKQVDDFLQTKLGIRDGYDGLSLQQVEYLEDVYMSHLYKHQLPLKGPVSSR